jgi:ATP-dependent helicase YprA (DUF1998 family)
MGSATICACTGTTRRPSAAARRSYVLTTGTGSRKSLSYFIPIVDWALRPRQAEPSREPRIAAIVTYPMNALLRRQRA